MKHKNNLPGFIPKPTKSHLFKGYGNEMGYTTMPGLVDWFPISYYQPFPFFRSAIGC
jgi:hypothetical protein